MSHLLFGIDAPDRKDIVLRSHSLDAVTDTHDRYPKALEIMRLGQVIPNIIDPRQKPSALSIMHAGNTPEKPAFAGREVARITSETEAQAVSEGKKVPKWGYNLSLVLLERLYVPADKMTHDKSLSHIQAGKKHYAKLDDVTQTLKIAREHNKEHPAKIDFSKDEKALSALKKAAEHGLVEKDKTVYTDKEIEVLIANLETEAKILPNKAQVEFGFVPALRELAIQTTRIVSKAVEIERELVRRSIERASR